MMQGTSSLITIDSKLSAEAKASSDNNTKKIQMKKIFNPRRFKIFIKCNLSQSLCHVIPVYHIPPRINITCLVVFAFLEAIPAAKDLFTGIPPNTPKQQNHISQDWMATNWNGICDELTKVSNHTLIIVGNHDNNVPTARIYYLGRLDYTRLD
jgi:hypothetical protein